MTIFEPCGNPSSLRDGKSLELFVARTLPTAEDGRFDRPARLVRKKRKATLDDAPLSNQTEATTPGIDLPPLWRTPQQARYDPSGGDGWRVFDGHSRMSSRPRRCVWLRSRVTRRAKSPGTWASTSRCCGVGSVNWKHAKPEQQE